MLISEYTGGGFGSKIPGAISMAIPALLSKKANAPVMMRITREEEHYIGRARPALHARVKVGFDKDGRITALDLFVIGDNGPYEQQGDCRHAPATSSRCCYQPMAMRWRGVTVLTNTPPRRLAARARRHAGHRADGAGPRQGGATSWASIRSQIRRINAPAGKAPFGPPNAARPAGLRDQRVRQGSARQGRRAVQLGRAEGAQRQAAGHKVRGSGVAVSAYVAGSIGFDGLFVIRPDGRVQFQSGIGNLGTHSVIDVHRVAAEMLGVPWEKCEVVWGNTARTCRGRCVSGGSQTTHAHDARRARGGDGRQEEAAGDCRQDARRRARAAIRSPTSASQAAAAA